MADPKAAIDFVLRQEDSALSGVITDYPDDPGGTTRFGLCAKWHPKLVSDNFFRFSIVDGRQFPFIGRAAAFRMAEATYQDLYTPSLKLRAVASQAVATAQLSFAVLEGIERSSVIVQQSVNACGGSIQIDGDVGPVTVTAINAVDPQTLLRKIIQLEEMYFDTLAKKRPSQERWLKGWDNRARALLQLL